MNAGMAAEESTADTTNYITIIESTKPATVNKRYTDDGKGGLKKTAIANITEGIARHHYVPDADAMVRLLQEVSQAGNLVICPGHFHGDNGEPFHVVAESDLARMLLGKKLDDLTVEERASLGGIHEYKGKRYAARVKRGITPSKWILLDADNPAGIPSEWAAMTIQERLEMLEPLLPGCSTCERLEVRGSSSRVHSVDEDPGPATHAWVWVDDPSAIERMRTSLSVSMVNNGLSFPSPRYSRKTGEVISDKIHRTVFDLSVFVTGRLVFCAQPHVEPAGYTVADADIRVVNRGGGPLRIAGLKLPDEAKLEAYRKRTGVKLTPKLKDGHISITSVGELTLDTEIEVKGVSKSLAEWLNEMKPAEKKRCEAPFRESQSEAAFIHKNEDGSAFVHDVGNGTTYTMAAAGGSRQRAGAPQLLVVDPTLLDGKEVPARRWVVKPWIPAGAVTGLYGDGGMGKTLAIQQLQTCTALGRRWFGLDTQPMRSLGVYCEDSLEELHRRQSDINRLYGCSFRELEAVRWLPRLGCDNILMGFERGGAVSTDFLDQIIAAAKVHGAELVAIDTVADTFGGNENDRGQVRQYIQSALARIAREIGGTVIACAHPSRSGLASGEGDGGSTGWSNAFRSRLSLEGPKKGKDDDAVPSDPDERTLVRRKANYASRDDVIALRWQDGTLVTTKEGAAFERRSAENVFLDLVTRTASEGRHVSHNNHSGNYAPKVFASHSAREGYRRRDFERAMHALFSQRVIRAVAYGRTGKEAQCIERCDESGDGSIPFDT